MILNGFLVDQHAAHEHKGEDEEPEGWHCEICEENLKWSHTQEILLTLKYSEVTKKVIA
jgi:hypothetical protein